MANPSLKAQIEAAKSALASDLAAPSLVTPPPKPPTTPAWYAMMLQLTLAKLTLLPIPAMPPITFRLMANQRMPQMLPPWMKRITRLEAKLLDNQRDLHTLLQKIREISRLQVNSGQSHKKLANDHAETMVIDEAKDEAVAHRSQRSPVIMVAMAVLIGLGAGITYFLATGEGDPSALKSAKLDFNNH